MQVGTEFTGIKEAVRFFPVKFKQALNFNLNYLDNRNTV